MAGESPGGATRVADPILAEVLRYELLAACEEMLITMRRATRSVVAKEGADYGTAILDVQGRIIAQPVSFGFQYFVHAVPYVIDKYGGEFRPGDVIVTNDPYGGASHLPDIVVIHPNFFEEELFGFTAVTQHHTDIGGRFPGGMGIQSESIFEEGIRLPAVRFVDAGVPNHALRDTIAANVRASEDVLGDLDAAVAACVRGERAMLALVHKHGRDLVASFAQDVVAQGAQRMRQMISSIPDGRYHAAEVFRDGMGTEVDLQVTMEIDGDRAHFDYTGSGPQVPNALNMPPTIMKGLTVNPFLGLLGEVDSLKMNSGLLEPLELTVPQGSVLNPRFPAAVGARTQIAARMMELTNEALAAALPQIVPAQGEGCPGAFFFSPQVQPGVPSGVLTDIYVSGWGARPDKDGIDGVMSIVMSGFRTASAEVLESETSVALDGFGFVTDSAGAGRYRGCLSVYRRWRFLAPGRALVRDIRSDQPARGRAGGHPGGPSSVVLIATGTETVLARQAMVDVTVKPGDVIVHTLSGGGGFGDPLDRDPEAVLDDVVDEKVSVGCAAAVYGVVVIEGTVTGAGTERLRRTMRATSISPQAPGTQTVAHG